MNSRCLGNAQADKEDKTKLLQKRQKTAFNKIKKEDSYEFLHTNLFI